MTSARALIDALAGANLGQHVLIVSPSREEARDALVHLYNLLEHVGVDCRLTRSNGYERLAFPSGGAIRIASPRSLGSVRGLDLDLVYLDDVELDAEARAELLPALIARSGAVVP